MILAPSDVKLVEQLRAGGGIAIVGIGCRFPDAPNVASFWSNLCAGVESVRTFTDDELEDGSDAARRAQPTFARARSVLEHVDAFDAGFFRMHAREAELTDPQQRIFLECAWEALEDAGYDPAAFPGQIGVFAGCSVSTYFLRNVLGQNRAIEQFTTDYQVGSYPQLIGSGHDFLATRVAYKLDLRGPAMTLQSACSTSLMAVAQACQTLLCHQADMMLAGAASITFPQRRGYLYQDGGMVASDGHCRTFDAHSSGTVFGAGVGIVLLKRLADAVAAGDNIYAVIRGFGVNNDGSAKIGYSAPSIEGQADAIKRAHTMAQVDPSTIHYVECHGTATPLGDPIEIAALRKAFGATSKGASCAIGSVKTNVGHLDVAAGMSGLIKTALAIRHGKIPPSLHFTSPNPRIDFAGSPFYVQTELTDWPLDDPFRRAGVSAFGLGGTNVHLVLEGSPEPTSMKVAAPELLILSGRSADAVAQARERLRVPGVTGSAAVADVAYTLQTGRRAFDYRCACVASDFDEANANLRDGAVGLLSGQRQRGEPRVAFMFPGQGAQYIGMGRGLYERFRVFREAIDACSQSAQSILGSDLRALIYPSNVQHPSANGLDATELAQPALFALEYALAQLWLSWGIRPAAMIGHSIGEIVAACVAGVFSREDALRLAIERGRLMQSTEPGAMLAVRLRVAELTPLLDSGATIAAVNGPALAVVAGTFDAITMLERRLEKLAVGHRRLHTSHAFHSASMDPIIAPLTDVVREFAGTASAIPCISGVSGAWLDSDEAKTPEYWGRHAREPVQFSRGIETLIESGITALIELGPGSSLATFARQTIAPDTAMIATSLPRAVGEGDDVRTILEGLGRCWIAGLQPDWPRVHDAPRRRVSLPTYPFERSRYWLDESPAPVAAESSPRASSNVPAPITSVAPALTEITTIEHHASVQASHAATPSSADHLATVQGRIVTLLEELSGEDLRDADSSCSFLELGFDSLFLGRFVKQLQTHLGVDVTFRQLLGDVPTIDALATYVAAMLVPAPTPPPSTVKLVSVPDPSPEAFGVLTQPRTQSAIDALMHDQLRVMQELMRDQLQTLQTLGTTGTAAAPLIAAPKPQSGVAPSLQVKPKSPSRFDSYRPDARTQPSDITPQQRAHIDDLIARTNARMSRSRALTQAGRQRLADPRAAAGFRSEWKEMVFPIACPRAQGSKLWDVDGNEYVDLVNGFGQTAFGHSPDFVVKAVSQQLAQGFPIGPQTELASEVAQLFCELTGNERATFCNTGSEAVMAALRVARTVTGRNRVVLFDGDYHGQFDEVLVKGTRRSDRSIPVASGIPNESVANMTVLTYGAPESIEWIRAHARELAAVIVEPVQSRHPALQPREFVRELRAITEASGTALVFDEVVTGFRLHLGGMQAVFDVRADLATYGKVVGGGLPIGILAGSARFMDALDGGYWQYGDDSFPTVAPTFFAGTFVRHPLAMSAVRAVLQHLKAAGPQLQVDLNERGADLAQRLNAELKRCGIEAPIESCGSLFYLNFTQVDRLAGLLFYHMRLLGVYVQEGYPCFLTTAHTDADIEHIVTAFAQSLSELQRAGILLPSGPSAHAIPSACMNPQDIALTEEQIEIWLCAQLSDEASCAFNESVTVRLGGALDEQAFRAAWERIIERHEALRATFTPTGESIRITAPQAFALTIIGLEAKAETDAARALDELVTREAVTPFDLVSGPLIRGTLVRLAPDQHAFILTAHHIVCDGWSMNVIIQEFATIYAARCGNTPDGLPAALPFSRYALQQRRQDPAVVARTDAFWLRQFSALPEPLELPTDRPRSALKSFRGATRSVHIDTAQYRAIKKAGAGQGCTLFVTLLASFGAFVGRLANRSSVVVAVPAAGQSMLEDEILVGHCVDLLPIQCEWSAQTRFVDYLKTVKRTVLDAYEHQTCTLGTIVRKLALPRGTNRLPLAEIQFNVERLVDRVELPALSFDVVPNPKSYVNFDLFLNIIESDSGLRLDCDYSTDLFDAATIGRWLHEYQTFLIAVAADTHVRIDQLYSVGGSTAPLPLDDLNETTRPYPHQIPVQMLFEQRVAEQPDAVALVCDAVSVSYAQLDARANRLAHHLLEKIAPGKLVGIAVDRSIDTVIALLATLKAGCAYLPLDPTHPAARLRSILGAAKVAALIVDASNESHLLDGAPVVVRLDRDLDIIEAASDLAPDLHVRSDQLAYTIYTSGSTGEPKGVEVTHRSLVNFLCSMANEPGLGREDVFLAITTISFDIAALELFLPLTVGATVVIATRAQTTDARALVQVIGDAGISALQATPAMWRMMLDAGFVSHPHLKMLCGGEALSRSLADRLLAGGGVLWNMYGPTETTIWSSCCRIIADGSVVTIGRPIANTQLYVLDSSERPVQIGTSGELHIGGDGVARGYVDRPVLTAQRFVSNPFAGGRMYRTGDSARVLASGDIEVLGRLDDQVKLRGFRIELGEVEATITKLVGVAAAAARLHVDASGHQRLVGYYVEEPGSPQSAATLRASLAQSLPEYMIPTAWVRLAQLPLTANGKLDRSALPPPEIAAVSEADFCEPKTATEIVLAKIWAETLKLDRVSTTDDLFALGVDSIHLFSITARANREGLRLMARQLMRHRTIGELAKHIDGTAAVPQAANTKVADAPRRPIGTDLE